MELPAYLPLIFISLTLLLFAVLLTGVETGRRRAGMSGRVTIVTGFVAMIWLAVSGVLAYTGFYGDFDAMPPRIPFMILPGAILVTIFALNKSVRKAMAHLKPQWAVGYQTFRILVEIGLWQLFVHKALPEQMTFEGYNFDVLAGLLAIPVVLLIRKGKATKGLMMAYNWMGILLLTTIVVIALLSTPTPLRVFMNEPANTIVTTWPYVWLPAFLVPMAYIGHIVSLRQWRRGEYLKG